MLPQKFIALKVIGKNSFF